MKSVSPPAVNRWKVWMVCGVAMVSFAAGSLLTARSTRPNQVRADNNRVFELLIYRAVPGKGPALESLFRDASKIMAKHGVNIVGYWVPNEDPAWNDTLTYLVAHPSRDRQPRIGRRSMLTLSSDPI